MVNNGPTLVNVVCEHPFTTPGNFKLFTIGKFIFTGLPIWEKITYQLLAAVKWNKSGISVRVLWIIMYILGICISCFWNSYKIDGHMHRYDVFSASIRILGLADFSYILTKYSSFREVIWFFNLNSYFDRCIFERMLWVSWILCFRLKSQKLLTIFIVSCLSC